MFTTVTVSECAYFATDSWSFSASRRVSERTQPEFVRVRLEKPSEVRTALIFLGCKRRFSRISERKDSSALEAAN